MTSKIIVNTIEADTGISSVTFASNINLANDSSILVSSSGIRLGTGSTIAAPSANEIALSTNSAERVRIDSSGNVGIGTDTIQANTNYNTLEIVGDAGTTGGGIVRLKTGNLAAKTMLFCDTGGFEARVETNHPFVISTNNTERIRITSAGRIGINQTSPEAMLQVDYDYANSEVGLRLRAASGSGTKTWQLSEINGNAGVFTIRNATNSQNNLSIDGSSGYVGINATNPDRRLEVVETAGSLTFPVAVSNHTDASAGVGAGIAFHLTAGGNARGDFGVVYAGNSNSDGTDFVFRPNDGSTGSVERLRIKGSSGATIISNAGTFPTSTNETLTIQGEGHNGHGTTNTRSVFNITAARNSNSNAAGLWIGARTNENTAVIGTRTASGNLAIETYNGGWGERLRITNAGYVLKSDTPAFKCKLSTATGANFTGVLVFGNVSYNIGSHYNSSNGRFTAPVDGRYLFCWYTNMERAGGNGSFYADWVINGNNQGNRMYTHHSGAWELIGGTVIFDLNANDYVQIKAITSGNWDGGSYGSYSGYLLG